jgi:hypothetical protein
LINHANHAGLLFGRQPFDFVDDLGGGHGSQYGATDSEIQVRVDRPQQSKPRMNANWREFDLA